MKKILSIVVICILLLSFVSLADSYQIGDVIGNVLYTDIRANIEGVDIQSFNINGNTAIYIKDLRSIGYSINYDDSKRLITASSLDIGIDDNLADMKYNLLNKLITIDKTLDYNNEVYQENIDSFEKIVDEDYRYKEVIKEYQLRIDNGKDIQNQFESIKYKVIKSNDVKYLTELEEVVNTGYEGIKKIE